MAESRANGRWRPQTKPRSDAVDDVAELARAMAEAGCDPAARDLSGQGPAHMLFDMVADAFDPFARDDRASLGMAGDLEWLDWMFEPAHEQGRSCLSLALAQHAGA